MTMRQLAAPVHNLTIIGECAGAMEAYNLLQQTNCDILLLDIEMPGMSGIELTRNLGSQKPVIIFTTSKKEYAVEAFELNVADYIVKPVAPARFIQAINKAKEIIESNKEEVRFQQDEFLFIRDSAIIRRLAVNDILFAEAMGDYVKLHTPQKFYAIHTTLKSVEEKLSTEKFARVHRSYIVALGKIDNIKDGAIQIGTHTIPVADAYRGALNRRLNIL